MTAPSRVSPDQIAWALADPRRPPAHGPGCKALEGARSWRDGSARFVCVPGCPRGRWLAEHQLGDPSPAAEPAREGGAAGAHPGGPQDGTPCGRASGRAPGCAPGAASDERTDR